MGNTRIELAPYSMFASTPVYDGISAEIEGTRQKVVVFGLMVEAVVPDATDELYRVPAGGESRLDLISQKFYGVPDLWWVIALVNNMLDPLVGATTGQNIRIPARNRLASEGILTV
jgi:nucleoid-associated protein YgaU